MTPSEEDERTQLFKSRSDTRFCLEPHGDDPFAVISPSDLCEILKDALSEYQRIVIVDCRFDYEFRGGHIASAVNVHTHEDLQNLFHKHEVYGSEVLLVFHCEFSRDRGPRYMEAFRKYDREVNLTRYPAITYPHLCLLEGGYRRFFHEAPELCTGGYVEMRDHRHIMNGNLKRSQSQYNKFLTLACLRKPKKIARSVSSGVHLSLDDITLAKSNSQ